MTDTTTQQSGQNKRKPSNVGENINPNIRESIMELKATPKGIKVNGKLFTKASQLSVLFAEHTKSENRRVRKYLHANRHRGLASVR